MSKRTLEEMKALWVEYKKTSDTGTRNELVAEYLPIVKYHAERLTARLPHNVDPEDLASVGIFGLLDAIAKFDLGRGVKFETYCSSRIRGAMLDELRALDWAPRLLRAKGHKLEKAYDALESRLGRAPTDCEMANEVGVPLNELDEMLKEISAASLVSLSAKIHGGEDATSLEEMEVLEDKKSKSPIREYHKREVVNFICKRCSRKERLILTLYYFEELTMKEIGATLDLSESRVCQIHAKLMLRLKNHLRKLRSELL
ncbi:MAG: FliA/WhiG family RNA polymerase sigma factor [Planctomycetota bacterium]|nr:FliA/WhiG family RNA polymerase sigma factor [Planctomycetota bacterium]